jgi:hypothetical protein
MISINTRFRNMIKLMTHGLILQILPYSAFYRVADFSGHDVRLILIMLLYVLCVVDANF